MSPEFLIEQPLFFVLVSHSELFKKCFFQSLEVLWGVKRTSELNVLLQSLFAASA